MKTIRDEQDLIKWKHFTKEEVGIEKFVEEVKEFFRLEDAENSNRARMMIQIDDPKREGFNASCITMDLDIKSYDILERDEEDNKRYILVINRYESLNQGTRVDLDLSNTNLAHITYDRDDNHKCLQIDGKGIWIDL